MAEGFACSYDIQQLLRSVFQDDTIQYDRARFAGGLTNYNYIVQISSSSYVVREPGFKTEEIIDRVAEQKNNEIASALGINSECVFFDSNTGIKISRLIPQARTFSDLNPASEVSMNAVVSLLKTVHNSGTAFANVFDWHTELLKYERIVRSLNCSFFSDYETMRDRLVAFIDTADCVFRSRPCHNDTVPENFLMRKKDKRAFLIDWEYSGMNDPAWDIAMYIRESYLPAESIRSFLSLYYGTADIDLREMLKLKLLVMAQDLLWSVWAMIRHYNGEDFLDYLYNRYNRFRTNLSRLTDDVRFPLSEMVQR